MNVGRPFGTTAPSEAYDSAAQKSKLILVRMNVIASEYDSSFFSAILLASCFIVRLADDPAPQGRKTPAERNLSSRQVFVAHTSGASTTHDTCTLPRSFTA